MPPSKARDMLSGLRLPLIAAPMFLVSGPDLVVACCKAGIVGTFPSQNQRTVEGFEAWVGEIEAKLAASGTAPYGVNLIVHKSNAKIEDELAVCVRHKVPVVITSLGAVRDLVDQVHAYGGIVLHDVASLRHAHKAAEAGVDGLIALSAGAGGHTGKANPIALVNEIKAFFDGVVLLSGALSTGADIAAAQMIGADLAYMGTRFIATKEAASPDEYKRMVVDAALSDIVTTDIVTGINATFMRASIEKAGIDLDKPNEHGAVDINEELEGAMKESSASKPWRDIWSAGEGAGSVNDIPAVHELVDRLAAGYLDASARHAERAKAVKG